MQPVSLDFLAPFHRGKTCTVIKITFIKSLLKTHAAFWSGTIKDLHLTQLPGHRGRWLATSRVHLRLLLWVHSFRIKPAVVQPFGCIANLLIKKNLLVNLVYKLTIPTQLSFQVWANIGSPAQVFYNSVPIKQWHFTFIKMVRSLLISHFISKLWPNRKTGFVFLTSW